MKPTDEQLAILDDCANPTKEQIEQMTSGIGAIFPADEALRLGMKTAVGNVKRVWEKLHETDR